MTINLLTKAENIPPPMNGRVGHRSSRSEEERRRRNGVKPREPSQTLDIFADPPELVKPRERRLRRNSESSVSERTGKPTDSEDERKRRERRHREREARYKDGKLKGHASSGSKAKKPTQRLDVIDKLDVTSIYGTGRTTFAPPIFFHMIFILTFVLVFHHDGPFDACNPHRNRKGSQRAPMQAFPKDSANNIIGGSGPVNRTIDLAQFHGQAAEGFTDYSASGKASASTEDAYASSSANTRNEARSGADTVGFNPTAKVEVVHGDETLGLGTSTFLEGAPAARTAIQRRESETEVPGIGGGLGRKRSLAQKIRGINNTRTGGVGSRGVYSPEPSYQTAGSAGEAQSAGGLNKIKETNPFFNDYDDAYEKKGAQIQIAEEQRNRSSSSAAAGGAGGRSRNDSVGGAPLERRLTSDMPSGGGGSLGVDSGEGKSGGFLSRVRSLRGGRRTRPQRGE